MDISVPSRFACLKIEDDEFRPVSHKSKKRNEKKPVNNGTTNTSKQVESAKPSKKKSKSKDAKQWEEWKQKDEQFVEHTYKQALQSAILQSKLDFEEKKNSPVLQANEQQQGKKKKNKTMSLDQFLEEPKPSTNGIETPQENEPDFFDKINETVKKEINKEQVKVQRKQRENNIEEVITLAHLQEKLDLERAKNIKLTKELEKAKEEISTTKQRNTTLCSMLSEGEMKDKESLLDEVRTLTSDKDDLTKEVARLHELLEQERSKAGATSDNHSKNKEKKHKRN